MRLSFFLVVGPSFQVVSRIIHFHNLHFNNVSFSLIISPLVTEMFSYCMKLTAADLLEWACVEDQSGAGLGGCSGPWGGQHSGDVEERLPGCSADHRGQPKCCQGDAEHRRPGWECAGPPLAPASVIEGTFCYATVLENDDNTFHDFVSTIQHATEQRNKEPHHHWL